MTTPEANIGSQKRIKKFSDFTILQVMGEGAYGKVNLCIHNKEHYIVVIKMIFKERILVDTWVRDRKLGTIPSEIQIMATLNKNSQENILKLLDFLKMTIIITLKHRSMEKLVVLIYLMLSNSKKIWLNMKLNWCLNR